MTSKSFISKYTKLLELLPETPKHHLEMSISKISTLSNEPYNNSILNDIQNDLNTLNPPNKWLSKPKHNPLHKTISLPINIINTPSIPSSSSNGLNKNKDVDILLRTKFDVQDYISSIHKRKTNKYFNFLINNNSRNSPTYTKMNNKSYSITNRLLDVYDHLNNDDPNYTNHQREYFHLTQKHNEEPKKSLINLTNRYNKIIKKEKEDLLFNKLKPNGIRNEFTSLAKGASQIQQQGQISNMKSNGILSERNKKPVLVKI